MAIVGCRHTTPPTAQAIGSVPAGSFVRAWMADLGIGKDPARDIFMRGDCVIVYTRGAFSYVVGRTSGEMRFIHEIKTTGGVLRPPILLTDKLVYPTATTLEIYAVKGKHLRTMELPNSTHGPGAGIGNTVYVSLDYPGAGRVGAVDLTRDFNIMKWELYTRAGVHSTPAVRERAVFIGSEDGTVFALDDERSSLWGGLPGGVFKTYGPILADLKVDDFGVYVPSGDSKLYCIDRGNGQVKWQYFAGEALDTAPAITPTTVYQYVPSLGMTSIEKTAGSYNRKPRWNVPGTTQFLSEDDRNAYLARRDHTIVAVDKLTGEERFASKTPYDFYVTNEVDSMIYGLTRGGMVVGIRPVTISGQVGVMVMNTAQNPNSISTN